MEDMLDAGEGWTILVYTGPDHNPATVRAKGLFKTDEEATQYVMHAQLLRYDGTYESINHFAIVRFSLQG